MDKRHAAINIITKEGKAFELYFGALNEDDEILESIMEDKNLLSFLNAEQQIYMINNIKEKYLNKLVISILEAGHKYLNPIEKLCNDINKISNLRRDAVASIIIAYKINC